MPTALKSIDRQERLRRRAADLRKLRQGSQGPRAERLLLRLVETLEREAAAGALSVPAWLHEELARIYHSQGDFEREVAVLERWDRLGISWPERLLHRLTRAREAAVSDPSVRGAETDEPGTPTSQVCGSCGQSLEFWGLVRRRPNDPQPDEVYQCPEHHETWRHRRPDGDWTLLR